MLANSRIIPAILCLFCQVAFSQTNTFSPYSRYGLGERAQSTFAHNMGMGGAYIALKPDSTMPLFVNAGNPASYALIRLTSLEVGGRYQYTDYRTANSGLYRWTTNFTYASLGFPMGKRAGACAGVMPYSSVGYSADGRLASPAGELRQVFGGAGGINKIFAGYGIAPFNRAALRYRFRNFSQDSLTGRSPAGLKTGYFFSKMISDLSAGFNVNFLFGNVQHSSRVIYPDLQMYNNTYLERSVSFGDFTGNFGVQTAITIDSVRTAKGRRRALSEKARFTFGFFMALGNELRALANSVAYNYVTTATGQDLIRDTVTFDVGQPTRLRLPVEQGIGIGFKKAERWNVVADAAVTRWNAFSAPFDAAKLADSYRFGIGASLVPEKFAAGRGAFWRRLNYRFGASYETGNVRIGGNTVPSYYFSAGFGVPVGIGRISSMVNISLQAGQTGFLDKGMLRETFFRAHVGFTFCDRWFQKFRYD